MNEMKQRKHSNMEVDAGTDFSEYKKRLLEDPEVRAAYDELTPEFELIASLIALRGRRGMSQDDLAEAVGTKQPAIARIESGRYRGMSVATLEKMARSLDARLVIRFEEAKKKRGRARVG